MNTNEIINNEEVIELVEDITEVIPTNVDYKSGSTLAVAMTAGALVLIGGLSYKYIVKPVIAKVKDLKDSKNADSGYIVVPDENIEVTDNDRNDG